MAVAVSVPHVGEYWTDGAHLYYVLHVNETFCKVEDCQTGTLEDIPFQQVQQMKMVDRGAK